MDIALQAVINSACAEVKHARSIDAKEREDFEDIMIDKILQGDPELKLYLLRRDCDNEDRYADGHINYLWWVWKCRADIARGIIPEPYPHDY